MSNSYTNPGGGYTNTFQRPGGYFNSPTQNYNLAGKGIGDTGGGTLNEAILLDMFKKGLIDEVALRQRLKAIGRQDTPSPEFKGKSEIDKLVELAQKKSDVSASTMAHALRIGAIDEAGIKARLGKDFDPEDADVMLKVIKNQAANDTPGLNLSQMTNGLKHGLVSQDDILARLKQQGYSQGDSQTLLNLMQHETKNKTLQLSALSDAFKRGDLKEADVLQRLTDKDQYDYSPEDAKLLLNDMKQSTKMGLGPLSELFVNNQLDPASVKEKLTKEHGYSNEDADLLMQTFQNDKNKAAQQAQEKAARDAKAAEREAKAEAREKKSDQRQAEADARRQREEAIQGFKGETFTDGVNGFLENFHRNFLSSLKGANLGPEATQWLMDNQHQVLNQAVGNGKEGGVFSGAQLQTIYEGQRGMQRANSTTHDTAIQAQTVG